MTSRSTALRPARTVVGVVVVDDEVVSITVVVVDATVDDAVEVVVDDASSGVVPAAVVDVIAAAVVEVDDEAASRLVGADDPDAAEEPGLVVGVDVVTVSGARPPAPA